MVDHCPGCAYTFAREDGSWLGAFVVNFACTEGSVALLLFVLVFNYAAADGESFSVVPYIVAAIGLSIAVPVFIYPYSKTIWTAIDLVMHRGRIDDDVS